MFMRLAPKNTQGDSWEIPATSTLDALEWL